MAKVIPTENLSEHLVRDVFRNKLRANAGASGSGNYLIDPKAGSRDAAHPFIVTSFPDTDPLFPMIVVREGSDSGSRPDRRHDLHEHDYRVTVQIAASSATTMFSLRDGVRAWFEDSISILESEGFEDASIDGSNAADWDSEISTETWQITFAGTVNTT